MPDLAHNWLQGHNITLTITRQTKTGVALADASGTAVALTTTWDNISKEMRDVLQEVSGGATPRENYIKLKSGFQFSVTYLLVNNEGADPDPLAAQLLSGNYYKIVLVTGSGSGSVVTYTIYAIFESHNENPAGSGPVRATVQFKCVDVGSGSFARVVA